MHDAQVALAHLEALSEQPGSMNEHGSFVLLLLQLWFSWSGGMLVGLFR